jgi:ABC-type multidrug transport system permease subunit
MDLTIKDWIVLGILFLVVMAIPTLFVYTILYFIPNKILASIIISFGTLLFASFLSLKRGF